MDVDSLSVIIAVRVHAANPWVLPRLRLLAGYYRPLPRIIIVDFGSQGEFAAQLAELCAELGFARVVVPDVGVFSIGAARNAGAAAAGTRYLYFTDVDFFAERGFFALLLRVIEAADLERRMDVVIDLPAYHLAEAPSAVFETAASHDERDLLLRRLGWRAVGEAFGASVEFIAPYSNNFACRADFFSLCGGYHGIFRGHGSEDFELQVRMACHADVLPLPKKLTHDMYGPTKGSFFGVREYMGFRRLNELVSFPAEVSGLRAFHLWHPTRTAAPTPEANWRLENDWKRERLNAAFAGYLDDRAGLLDVDFMPRPRTALCVCKDPEHWGFFTPFRLLGYRLHALRSTDPAVLAMARSMIERRAVDAFLVFNPYMKSHAEFLPLFELCRANAVRTIVVERGALPATIYYADDVSYNDPEFDGFAKTPADFTASELAEARAYMGQLRTGGRTLERNGAYDQTVAAVRERIPAKGSVFLPLQLFDDMAVTRYVRGEQSYAGFVEAIARVAAEHPQLTFVVKPHPLSKQPFTSTAANVVCMVKGENVHALIDLCEATICYNSGVGLLTLIHGRPLVTIGNAFYNVPGTGGRAANLDEAVRRFAAGLEAPRLATVECLVAWLLFRKYSTFIAEDAIRDFKTRSAHGYAAIKITRLNWYGQTLALGRQLEGGRLSANSYANGRLGLHIGLDLQPAQPQPGRPAQPAQQPSSRHRRARLLRKFLRNPRGFVVDAFRKRGSGPPSR